VAVCEELGVFDEEPDSVIVAVPLTVVADVEDAVVEAVMEAVTV
jgi:hypothetical protein